MQHWQHAQGLHLCARAPTRHTHLDPDEHDGQQDGAQVGRGGSQRAKADDHELLDERAAGLAQRVADHVNRGLALHVRACVGVGVGGG